MERDEAFRGALERKMRAPLSAFRELARGLPDDPALVDVRGLLLSGRCRVLRDTPESTDFIVAASDSPLVCIVGQPLMSLIQLAVTGDDELEVIASGDSIEHVSQALPDWLGDEVRVLTLPDPEAELPAAPAGGGGEVRVRLLSPEDRDCLGPVEDELRGELEQVLEQGSPLAASFVDEIPASFCYPVFETERWWDVSVDTLEPFRRRGLASLAFRRMLTYENQRGRSPVWAAVESNAGSLGLATKLGFEAVDGLALFRRRG
ncbi:hypothetical protein ABI59_00350 [Acidobacteria bacterium Mor1]|nr:hypothetical protein ABI59_00350 [Acidobacteria bacterium Mor1]